MRLIDEDALKAALVPLWNCHDDTTFANRVVWRELENAPTIDAVPVVRCKDCMYKAGTEDGEYNPEDIVCTYWMSDGLNEDDYCSYGERKEE